MVTKAARSSFRVLNGSTPHLALNWLSGCTSCIRFSHLCFQLPQTLDSTFSCTTYLPGTPSKTRGLEVRKLSTNLTQHLHILSK